MKYSLNEDGWKVMAFEDDSPDADLFTLIPDVALDKVLRRAFSSSTNWENVQTRVVFDPTHPLYDHLFEIYAVGIYEKATTKTLSSLTERVLKHCNAIIQLLSTDTTLSLREVEEQQRWCFLTMALSHCYRQMSTRKIGDIPALKQKAIQICQLLDEKLSTRDFTLRLSLREMSMDLDGSIQLFLNNAAVVYALRSKKKAFNSTLEWKGKNNTVSFPCDHVLYFDIFEIYHLSRSTIRPSNEAVTLAKNVVRYLNRIIGYLRTNPKINLNLEEEQLRWSFLLSCLSHLTLVCQIFNLHDTVLLDKISSELIQLIKPHIGNQHRIATRYLQILKLDLACRMAIDCLEKNELALAEDYLYVSLYGSQKYLVTNQENRFAMLFMIYNCLADIHIRRGDYLAAEVQYDEAVRFICSNVIPYHKNKDAWIPFHVLANHYRTKGQWHDEKRLRSKTIQVCDLFLTHAEVVKKIPLFKDQIEASKKHNQTFLNNGCFFNETPVPVLDHVDTLDAKRLTITFKTKAAYQKILALLSSEDVVIPKLCSEETMTIQLKTLPASFNVKSFHNRATQALCPQQVKPKAVKSSPARLVAIEEVLPDTAPQDTIKDLSPSERVTFSAPKDTKRVPNRTQRGNKAKKNSNPSPSPVNFFVSQQRALPPCVRWQDQSFGELIFNQSEENSTIMVMRNEHNCGKPVFGLLCIDLIRVELSKHYRPQEVEPIMAVMINTFTEAKQARFFGRGIKSCPTDPKVKDTEFRLVLKPSTGFNNQFRVYGRCLHNGEYTLFIFHAIDVAPKSAASKLIILEPEKKKMGPIFDK